MEFCEASSRAAGSRPAPGNLIEYFTYYNTPIISYFNTRKYFHAGVTQLW